MSLLGLLMLQCFLNFILLIRSVFLNKAAWRQLGNIHTWLWWGSLKTWSYIIYGKSKYIYVYNIYVHFVYLEFIHLGVNDFWVKLIPGLCFSMLVLKATRQIARRSCPQCQDCLLVAQIALFKCSLTKHSFRMCIYDIYDMLYLQEIAFIDTFWIQWSDKREIIFNMLRTSLMIVWACCVNSAY